MPDRGMVCDTEQLPVFQHSPQNPMMALEALIHFRQAVPFEGAEINVHVKINVPNRTLNAQWTTDHKNVYQQ